jgi:methionine-rich copper-binding protein CopC
MRRSILILVAVVLAAGLLSQVAPPATLAANPNVGYVDQPFGSAPGSDPTADKPQSKLWWNDGAWWAVMFNQSANEWHIYQLSWPDKWNDTTTVVDTRPTSRADALWDGDKLYIASLVRFSASNQAQLRRYSYNSGTRTYTLDAGFPATMMSGSAETLAFDKDSTGQLWITYTQNNKVYVNRSTTSDSVWGTPFVVPGPTSATNLASDDISSLVAYTDHGTISIGVLWSNHNNPSSMYFAYHKDSDDDMTWQPIETIYTATCAADDHINIKSLQSDASGAIYAAVKTSFGDSGCGSTSSQPLINLVVRKPNGSWIVAPFDKLGDNHTRPLVLLDTTNRVVYMFATSPTSCGIIYMKSTSMDNPDFSNQPGKGTPFVSSSTYTCINNVTSTKQTVNSATGLVVLASDESKKVYLHNVLALGAPPADTTPPIVTAKTPAAGAANVAIGTTVTATFSEPVANVTPNTFSLTPAGGTQIGASVTYDAATRTATLTPAVALAPSTSYTARLISPIADSAGNPLATVSWSFTTSAPPPDTTPPTVVARSPLSGATNVDPAVNITATFSEDIAPTSINAASVTLSGASGVPASISYNAASRTVTLDPNADLNPSSTYTVQLTSAITDLFGNPLAPVSWSFATAEAAPDTAAPTVVSISPADAAINISPTTAISATFSEPIDSATLTGANFTLTSANGAVAATITYDSATETATLQPQVALAAGATYTIRISGVSDLAGNELEDDAIWRFTTAAGALQRTLLMPASLR